MTCICAKTVTLLCCKRAKGNSTDGEKLQFPRWSVHCERVQRQCRDFDLNFPFTLLGYRRVLMTQGGHLPWKLNNFPRTIKLFLRL